MEGREGFSYSLGHGEIASGGGSGGGAQCDAAREGARIHFGPREFILATPGGAYIVSQWMCPGWGRRGKMQCRRHPRKALGT